MSSALQAVPSAKYYKSGDTEICFRKGDQGLSVTIETSRLYIRSVKATEKEYGRYAGLFGNAKVMEKFAKGAVKTREEIEARIKNV